MQAKHKSLLERVDALDEECEELQRQLGEKEEAQTNLNIQLQKISELKEQQQAQLSQQQVDKSPDIHIRQKGTFNAYLFVLFHQDIHRGLQKEKQTLQTHVDELGKRVAELMEHVQALAERERLLVAFPELNNWAQSQPQSKEFPPIYKVLHMLAFLIKMLNKVLETFLYYNAVANRKQRNWIFSKFNH